MNIKGLLVCAALALMTTLFFFQIGVTSASAGRGCKMGADCNYNASGSSSNKTGGHKSSK